MYLKSEEKMHKRNDDYRIVIPIWGFSKAGGIRVLSNLANCWAEQGIDVVVLCYYISDGPYFPIETKIQYFDDLGNATGRIDPDNSNNMTKIDKLHGLINESKGMLRVLNRLSDRYNVVIANLFYTAFSVSKCKIKHKYYYIQAYEAFEKEGGDSFSRFLLNCAVKKTYSLPLIRIVNADLYKNYKEISSSRVVYPGIDLKLYFSKDTSYFSPIIKIGTIGRTEEWKGTADVCRAMEILDSEGVKFEFYLAFNDFETIPHRFVKPDGDDNLSAFYREMDIVVAACKGQHGAIHYPVIETMAVGSTIVCTDYYPSNITNAYKVNESSPEQIAEAIKHIINHKSEAIEKRNQAIKDVQQFDWPVLAKKFLGYIAEGDKQNDHAK